MKKITLALLAAFSSVSMVYSQANISIEAPVHTQNFIDVLPGGATDEATLTAVYLVNQSELSALTGTALTGLGIQVAHGVTGTPVNGTFSVYLQNTNDVTYNAGTSFTAATGTMSLVYNGTFNPGTSQTQNTIAIPFAQTYTYTGGGLYVAVKWQATTALITPNSTNSNLAAYPSNGVGTTAMGAIEEVAQGSAITDIMSPIPVRPSFIFKAVNQATNEVGVLAMNAPGKVAKSINAGHVVQAIVRNSSINTLSNVSVSLTVTGANPFTNTQVIPSLAAGATATVSFAAYNPTVQGVGHMTVSVANDQNNANNKAVWTQSVTCNVMGNNPPDVIGSFSTGIGFQNGGIFSTPYTPGNNATLTAVRISISSDSNNSGKKLSGVIMDASGTIIGATDTVLAANASFQTFVFRPSQVLTAGTTYFIGMEQMTGPMFPMGCELANLSFPMYFASPSGGGSLNNNSNFGYFGIEPILGPDVQITALSNTIVCLGDAISLQGDGAVSYSWSAVPNTTVNSIPTPTANPLSIVPTRTETVTFTLKGADAAGCVNSTTLVAKVTACTGLTNYNVKEAQITVYPNPAVNGKSTVTGLQGSSNVIVYNVLGEVIINKNTTEESISIDLSNQPQGTYLVKVTDSDNHAKTVKIVNQN